MWKLSVAQKAEVVAHYLAGQSTPRLARQYAVSDVAIRGVLRRRGVFIRCQQQAQTRHSLKHDALDVLTPEAAYWCGFLFADGTISTRPRQTPEVAVVLSEQDREHLEKFRGFLGSTHAMTALPGHQYGKSTAQPAWRFSVRSRRLADQLYALGRYGGLVDEGLVSSRDFWRGVVDGDGYIGLSRGVAQFKLVGSARLLGYFVQFLSAANIGSKPTVRPHRSISVVATTWRAAERVIDLLYSDATVGLDRKVNAAKNILAAGLAVTGRGDLGGARSLKRQPLERTVAYATV